MDQALNQKIDAYIAQNKEQLLKDIAALVAVNSVEGTPEEGAPYGAGPRAALDKTLELAAGMGLATRNCENYIGYAELAGKDPEKYLATICHVDVVPVGNGWTADPFTMRIQDGWLLGRGVADDKGPMVATLYALKFLKEQGYELRYPIRALAGTNEETHMQDVDYYLKNYPAPVFCFTPDAEFPVCNGEKGHFGAELVSPVCNGEIKEFEGGVANNAVPDRASALVETDITKLKNAPNITLEPEGNGVRIRGWGKSGHAAMPEGTVNAIGMLARYALEHDLCSEDEAEFLRLAVKIMDSTDGSSIGIDTADAYFDPLTCIAGTIHMVDAHLELTIDIRFPSSTTGEELQAKLSEVADEYHATCENTLLMVPFLVDPQSPAIQMLASSYHDATGLDGDPFTIGGGTYAREFPCAASFGPEDPHDEYPEWVGPMHGADEGISEETLRRAMRTYILAIKRLMEIDLESLAK